MALQRAPLPRDQTQPVAPRVAEERSGSRIPPPDRSPRGDPGWGRPLGPIALVIAATGLTMVGFELFERPLAPWLGGARRDFVEIALILLLCGCGLAAVWRAHQTVRRSRERLLRLAEQRQRAGEALRESLDRTQAVLEAVADGIFTLDETGVVVSANRAAHLLFGCADAALMGRSFTELVPDSAPGLGQIQTGGPEDEPRRFETFGRRSDGSRFPLELTLVRVRTPSRSLFLASVHDLTGRRRAAEDVRRERDFAEGLLETAPVIVLVLDPNGRIVRFNRCMEEISGYTLDEVRDEDWFTTFLPEAARAEARRMLERARRGLPAQGFPSAVVTKAGQLREIEWSGTTLHNAQGEITGVLAVGRDVTERKRLESQLLHAQKMEAIGRLAGGVAHDFNTMLLTIGGRAEQLLGQPDLPAAAEHQLEEIAKAVGRATQLTRQLLAFSRQEAGALQPLDLNRVIRELEDMVRRLIGEDIAVTVRPDEDLWPVLADRGQVEQVLLNLVVNARDAMPDGGTLAIETENTETVSPGSTSPVARVLLRVRDTGHGMDAETLKRAFEPFFTTKEVGTGTGLGLSTVYGIVTQGGGDIQLESTPGQGTQVLVFWPRARARPARDGAAEATSTSASAEAAGSILLVEDDEAARELLKDFLEERGYRVVDAATGEEALGVLRGEARDIDLLITDWRMPGMSGTELADRVREESPETAVLYISGWTSQQLPVHELQRLGVRFLHKPFSLRDLAAAAEALLRERQETHAT